jgi:hypothetical protein
LHRRKWLIPVFRGRIVSSRRNDRGAVGRSTPGMAIAAGGVRETDVPPLSRPSSRPGGLGANPRALVNGPARERIRWRIQQGRKP